MCNESIGQCQCDTEWRGEYCQIPSCPNNCDNHGDCIDKECHCQEGYTGEPIPLFIMKLKHHVHTIRGVGLSIFLIIIHTVGIDCSLLADMPHWIVQNITNIGQYTHTY